MALAAVLWSAPGGRAAGNLDEVKKLLASDAQAGDSFGGGTAGSIPGGVAVSGDTAVVGAYLKHVGGKSDAGAAYVFQRDQGGAGNWGEVKKLTASDAQASDWFGGSVAIGGDTVVVGAMAEDAGGQSAGAAYVFQRDQGGAGNWGEVKKLTASDAEGVDQFGMSVAVSGDTVVVGASTEDAGGQSAGAAYVFQRDQGGADNWGEVKKLTTSDASASDQFGRSVAVSGDTTVAGALQADSGGFNGGAVYVFQRDEGGTDNWGEVKKLTASDAQAGDRFGGSMAFSGDTVVVGARSEDAGGNNAAGAAYVFHRDQGGADNWGEVKKLTASDAQADDRFGFSVAVSDDSAVVGANGEDAGGDNAGAAYAFQRDEGGADNWGEVNKLTASDAEADDWLGFSVAISGDTAVVGAPLEDEAGTGAGAAYVFGCAAVPWPTPAGDEDCDGWTTADEGVIGTEPTLGCSLTGAVTHPGDPTKINDEDPDAWPADMNDDQVVNLSDILFLAPPVFFSVGPNPPYNARFDLNLDNVINLSDILYLAPPMFFATCTP